MRKLLYLHYEREEEFLGGMYVYAATEPQAIRRASFLGAPAGATVGAHAPENEDLVRYLPEGFIERWLSPEEVMDSNTAVLRAMSARHAARSATA